MAQVTCSQMSALKLVRLMIMDKKGIWKTGGLATVVTLVFAVFVFKFDDWIGNFSPEFVFAQLTVTKVIPQVAVGSYDGGLTKYITVIQIINTGPAAIRVGGNFYNANGSRSTLEMKSNLIPAGFTGTLPATNLGVGDVMTITADTAASGTINWAKIVTTGAAAVSAYFELRDGATNILYNRTGITGSSATMSKFVVPRVRNVASGLDVGFAIVNTGATAAAITLTAKDQSGGVIAARTFTLAAGNHLAGFPFQLLAAGQACSPCLGSEPSGTNYGFLSFESSSAAFASTALAIEGPALSSLPVEVLQ
jgi:hypothetical protein